MLLIVKLAGAVPTVHGFTVGSALGVHETTYDSTEPGVLIVERAICGNSVCETWTGGTVIVNVVVPEKPLRITRKNSFVAKVYEVPSGMRKPPSGMY